MSTEGRALADFIQDIRRFCRQGAALLKTADEFLARHGWENGMKSNIAYAESSASLNVPERWLPQELARIYKSSTHPRNAMFVALLLDDDKLGDYNLTEPLATAGWVEVADPISTVTYWWSRLHGYREDRRNDGTIRDVAASAFSWAPKADFLRTWTLGVPLVGIKSVDALREQLLAPLYHAFEDYATKARLPALGGAIAAE